MGTPEKDVVKTMGIGIDSELEGLSVGICMSMFMSIV